MTTKKEKEKILITEISEQDFRKLDIQVVEEVKAESDQRSWHFEKQKVSLNDILDKQIKGLSQFGFEEDYQSLLCPVTIAIHKDGGFYWDKFMNKYTGPVSYQFGFNIGHLYSTRDYFECHDGDYWRVAKKETAVIYRIYLDTKWAKEFVIKHKYKEQDWPYTEVPDGIGSNYDSAKLVTRYDLQEDGSWIVGSRTGEFGFGKMKTIIPVDENGKRIPPSWEKDA